MFQFPKATLDAFIAAPDSWLSSDWEVEYHALLAHMGSQHPEWCEGVKVVPNDGEFISSGVQYREYLKNVIRHGVKFEVDNTQSYWMIKLNDTESTGERSQYISLEYVSQFGGVFTGHGIEYFPADASFTVFGALRCRAKRGMTTERSPFGFASTVEANAMFGMASDYSWS